MEVMGFFELNRTIISFGNQEMISFQIFGKQDMMSYAKFSIWIGLIDLEYTHTTSNFRAPYRPTGPPKTKSSMNLDIAGP